MYIDWLLGLRSMFAGWLDGVALHGTLWGAGFPKPLGPAPADATR
jgi:hypothetical protein